MTSPDGEIPNGQYDFPVNTGSSLPVGAAWYADQDESDWRSIIETPMRTSWNKAFEKMLLAPLSYLLAWILGGSPTDWDTLAEVQANLIPALMRLPIKILSQLLGLIPIVGQNIENTLTDYLAATANTASTASSAASSAVSTANSASSAATAAQSAASSAQTAVNQVATNITNAISGGVAAGTGVIAQAYDTIASIFGLAGAASATATAVATQAAQSAAQQNANAAKGVSNSVVFFGADGAAVPSVDWTDDGSGNIVIRGSAGRAGIKSSAADGTYGKLFNYPTATPNQSVIVVVGEKVNATQPGYLLCRIDSGFTRGGYVRYDDSGVTLGRFTKSGTAYSWTAWASQSRTINPGDMIEYCCIDATYYVYVNRVLVLTYTDSSVTLSYGTTTLYGGFAMSRYTVPLLGIVNDAFRLASFSLSDKAGSIVIGIGWRVHRASTSNATGVNATADYHPLSSPAWSVFDTTVNTSQVTITNQAQGVVTIQRAGYYQIVGSLNSSNTSYLVSGYVLYVNGSRATGLLQNGQTTWLYLNAGDTCAIGYQRNTSGSTGGWTGGEAGGGDLYFGGFLMQTAS